MEHITKDIVINLFQSCNGKAVSIYLPTYTAGSDIQKNRIFLKNLIQEARDLLLAEGGGTGKVSDYLAPLNALNEDALFRQNQSEGLALFLDDSDLRIFRLPERFDPLVMVGDHFHITPLVPIVKGDRQFHLLSLNKKRPTIYQGSKYELERVAEQDLDENLQAIFDKFYDFERHVEFLTMSGSGNLDFPGRNQGVYFGQSGGEENVEAEIRNFFHRFDAAIKSYLGEGEIPLVLAGVGFLHPIFRDANTYPYLLDTGIMQDVDFLSAEALHKRAWEIVHDHTQTDLAQALDVYYAMKDKNEKTTEAIEEIVPAAHFKRVDRLFLARSAHVWGKFDPVANQVSMDNDSSSENEDLLSLAAAQTLINGGSVLVIDSDQVPGDGPAAAILRF